MNILDFDALPKPPELSGLAAMEAEWRKHLKKEARKKELLFALRTRLLTRTEEAEAHDFGDQLNIECGYSSCIDGKCVYQSTGQAYKETDKRRELADAWYAQRRLQHIPRIANGKTPGEPSKLDTE